MCWPACPRSSMRSSSSTGIRSTTRSRSPARSAQHPRRAAVRTREGQRARRGFAAAHGDIIVMLDADGSTDPLEIPRFVDALLEGTTSRRARASCGEPAATTSRASAPRQPGPGRDGQRALPHALHRPLLRLQRLLALVPDRLQVDCDGFEVETLINTRVARAGLSVAEVPSIEHARIHGLSNLNAIQDGWRVLGRSSPSACAVAGRTSTTRTAGIRNSASCAR